MVFEGNLNVHIILTYPNIFTKKNDKVSGLGTLKGQQQQDVLDNVSDISDGDIPDIPDQEDMDDDGPSDMPHPDKAHLRLRTLDR